MNKISIRVITLIIYVQLLRELTVLSFISSGFNEGSLMFHDIAHSASSNGTNFPSGNFSSPETVVMDFCCRNDGYIDTPMKLPTNHSYVLFPFYLKGCQVIEGILIASYRSCGNK